MSAQMRNMRKTAGRFYAVILGVTERLYAVKLKDKIGNKKQKKFQHKLENIGTNETDGGEILRDDIMSDGETLRSQRS